MDNKKERVINEIRKFKKRLSMKYKVDKLILFGSYAKNKYNKFSDVDLLIVSKDFKRKHKLKRNYPLYFFWDSDVDIDLLCYTPEEVEMYSKAPTICKIAIEEGIEV